MQIKALAQQTMMEIKVVKGAVMMLQVPVEASARWFRLSRICGGISPAALNGQAIALTISAVALVATAWDRPTKIVSKNNSTPNTVRNRT